MTSGRWAKLLRGRGFRVEHTDRTPRGRRGVMIGLHAVHAREVLMAWKGGPRICVITGTDLRGPSRELALDTLRRVEAIVVLQPLDRDDLGSGLGQKTRVILPSVRLPSGLAWTGNQSTTACSVSHLRAVKDPLALPEALALEAGWQGLHIGGELESGWGALLRDRTNFRWLGELSRKRTLKLMSRCGCFVIPSFSEGCSNALCEAVALGMPIVASDIAGNRGLLGEEFGGYFPAGDRAALAACLAEPKFRPPTRVREQLHAEREADQLEALVRELDF